MYLCELRIENFRVFGEQELAFVLPLRPGLTALVGENDSGKTAVVDALRLALGTRDQEFFRVDEADFHQPPDGSARRTEIRIRCKFDDLARQDMAAFAEYLTYEDRAGANVPVLYLNWTATSASKLTGNRRYTDVQIRSGQSDDGPHFDAGARALLCATYLRPLRDAERALSAGRGSRLSQILQHSKDIKERGAAFDPAADPPMDPGALSVLGIGDYATALLGDHPGVHSAQNRLNTDFLRDLSFHGDRLEGFISVSGAKRDAEIRLRQLLEKLELELRDEGAAEPPPSRGLGSNNLLFMACELLLLGSEEDGFPLLLVTVQVGSKEGGGG
jgi:putative ATP-dependent endonuclease of OLD family